MSENNSNKKLNTKTISPPSINTLNDFSSIIYFYNSWLFVIGD